MSLQKHASASRTWQNLPEWLAIVLGKLLGAEIEKLRLVSKDWRTAVSEWKKQFAGKLRPKQLAPPVVAYPNATALSCEAVEDKLRSEEFQCMGQLKQLTSLDLYNIASLEEG